MSKKTKRRILFLLAILLVVYLGCMFAYRKAKKDGGVLAETAQEAAQNAASSVGRLGARMYASFWGIFGYSDTDLG